MSMSVCVCGRIGYTKSEIYNVAFCIRRVDAVTIALVKFFGTLVSIEMFSNCF